MSATLSKKLGQFKQWTGERLGTTDKTNVCEDFRRLDLETESRKDGIENLTISFTDYAKTLDKRSSQDKKISTLSMLSKSLTQQGKFHGESSPLGLALLKVGEAEDHIQGLQEEFAQTTRHGIVQDLMDLHASMKDYEALKKKLENRRLDYDAKLNKFNKGKKEKPGLEEEVQTAKKKYNETLADIEKIMETFAAREEAILEPLIQFANAQASFFEKNLTCLLDLKESLKSEKLETIAANNSKIYDKADVVRRGSNLKTVLPSSHLEGNFSKSGEGLQRNESAIEKPKAIENVSRNPSIIRNGTGHPVSNFLEEVEALYDFQAENEGELSMKKGDKILVKQYIDDGWWLGESNKGVEGIFPANYVKRNSKKNGREGIENVTLKNSIKNVNHKVTVRETEINMAGGNNSCHQCGCNEFVSHAFKPGKCNNCFHCH